MRNPFRSEADAYRFLLVTVAYFAAIVIAATLGGRWAGLGVFAALTLAALASVVRRRPAEPPAPLRLGRRDASDLRRILVVANETVAGESLREEIRQRSQDGPSEVLVVCPALNSPLRHWASDEDAARAAANERLRVSLARLAEVGIEARGQIGEADPLQAIEDALRTFGADEIIISTHPEGRSNWLERGVVDRARERCDIVIRHVVVDLEAEREEVR